MNSKRTNAKQQVITQLKTLSNKIQNRNGSNNDNITVYIKLNQIKNGNKSNLATPRFLKFCFVKPI